MAGIFVSGVLAGLALHFAYYNLRRIHGSLGITPAMVAGITDHAGDLQVFDRGLILRVAVIVVPLELIALLGFYTCPIDIGYPHPVLPLIDAYPMGPGLFRDIVVFAIGYGDLFLLILILAVACRFIRRLISPR